MKDKILLTGHKGFIGSVLYSKLTKKGYHVSTFDLDVKDYNEVRKWIQSNKPNYVIHLASTNSVVYSYEHYMDVLETNFMATVNIAEACRKLKNFRQFIFASSTEVYGDILNNPKGKLAETSKQMPNHPHAVAKVAAEIYLEQLGRVHNFPYTILRSSNTYGRTEDSNFLIESLVINALSGKPIKLGNPDAIRDFMYVEDHAEAYMKALDNSSAIKQTINICTGKGYGTLSIAKLVIKLTKSKSKIELNSLPKRLHEAKIVIGDNSKAKRTLNWRPKYDLESGLKQTIKYWENNI